jgi:hypothetical protein
MARRAVAVLLVVYEESLPGWLLAFITHIGR